jgi:hypothetical protein
MDKIESLNMSKWHDIHVLIILYVLVEVPQLRGL